MKWTLKKNNLSQIINYPCFYYYFTLFFLFLFTELSIVRPLKKKKTPQVWHLHPVLAVISAQIRTEESILLHWTCARITKQSGRQKALLLNTFYEELFFVLSPNPSVLMGEGCHKAQRPDLACWSSIAWSSRLLGKVRLYYSTSKT